MLAILAESLQNCSMLNPEAWSAEDIRASVSEVNRSSQVGRSRTEIDEHVPLMCNSTRPVQGLPVLEVLR